LFPGLFAANALIYVIFTRACGCSFMNTPQFTTLPFRLHDPALCALPVGRYVTPSEIAGAPPPNPWSPYSPVVPLGAPHDLFRPEPNYVVFFAYLMRLPRTLPLVLSSPPFYFLFFTFSANRPKVRSIVWHPTHAVIVAFVVRLSPLPALDIPQ